MICVIARLEAEAVCAARVFAVCHATSFAYAAVATDFLTFTFCTVAALIADPSVLFAAISAMVAANKALLHFIAKAEAMLTFRTMRIVRLDATEALTALIAHLLFAGSAVPAVLIVVLNTLVAEFMLFATSI